MKAMNSPMPTPMARRRSCGMARITASRTPRSTSARTTSPSSTTSPIAVCQEPVAGATWKATTALSPMPEARASGKSATTPMRIEATAAAAAVPTTAAGKGTPAAARIAGFATRMYAMVRNVAAPPRTSVAIVEPRRSGCRSRRIIRPCPSGHRRPVRRARHRRLDLGDLARRARQPLEPAPRDDVVVLDAHADVRVALDHRPDARRHGAVARRVRQQAQELGVHVHAGLDGEDVALLDRALAEVVARRVVHLEPDAVPEPVRQEERVLLAEPRA